MTPLDLAPVGLAGGGGSPLRLAVVVKGYPRLSETFVAQELLALQERGIVLDIWSLRHPTDRRRHALHDRITAPAHYLPEYLYQEPLRVLRALFRLPVGQVWTATRVWWRDLRRDPTANRVRRFGQALVLAAELPADPPFLYVHFLHTPGSVTRYAALIRGVGWGFSAHAKDIWTTPEWEKREKLAAARFGITCTAVGAAHLRALAEDPARIELVYHGLDLGRFPDPPDRGDGEDGPVRDGATPERAVEILSVGRLVEKKGYDRLLDALATLPDDLHWRLVHIGSGPLAGGLRAQAERLGLTGRIAWHGAQDQAAVIAALRQADLFVLTSVIAGDGDRDGLPNVLMEAASQKLAILSTAVAAIPEFIVDGVHGMLSDGTPEGIAGGLERLLPDPGLRRRLGGAAYARLRAEFGMAAGIDRLVRRLSEAAAV